MEEKKAEGRKCFIITPIGDLDSEIFRMAKGVIESVIKPLLLEHGYDDIKPSYEINQTGMITTQVINRIIDDDLVIANLTGNNPNVMYELCLRHVTSKPIIHICQNGTTLPFDIKDSRTIFYKNDMLGVQELREQMDLFVQEIDYDKDYSDNPIYNAKTMGKLLKEVPKESENKVEIELLQIILKGIERLNLKQNSSVLYPESKIEMLTSHVVVSIEDEHVSKSEIDKCENELDNELLNLGFSKCGFALPNFNDKHFIYKWKNRPHSFAEKDDMPYSYVKSIVEKISLDLKISLKTGFFKKKDI